jgi:hypothetical protein
MDTKTFEEELARQNAQLESAMKSLAEMGEAGIAIPEEALRALDAACEVRIAAPSTFNHPGIRA